MKRDAGLTLGQSLTVVLLVTMAVAGGVLVPGLPMLVFDETHDASVPFTTWEQLLEERPTRKVKLKGRILASVAPSHAGFAAFHKQESYKDSNDNTCWRTVLSDEPDLLMELSADGPSVKVLGGYAFESPLIHEFGGYRYEYIPLEREVWLLGTLWNLKDVPLETERVNALADAGPAQKLPVIRAKFIACSTVDEYISGKRWERALLGIPGLFILLMAVLILRSNLKDWAKQNTA